MDYDSRMTTKNKKNHVTLFVVIVVFIFLVGMLVKMVNKRQEQERAEQERLQMELAAKQEEYQQAISYIESQQYQEAEEILKGLESYEDSKALLAYVIVCTSDSIEEQYQQCRQYIAYDYDGALAKLLRNKRTQIYADYEKYAAEEKEKAIREGIPYVGMLERYLSSTSLGTAYFYGSNSVHGKNIKNSTADIYYYYEGNSIIFAVRIVDGKVYDVSDFRNNPWNRPSVYKKHPYENGEVKGGKISESSKGSTYESSKSDVYDVNNYDSADDFADDWEEDFDSYDDAYDYWEDHH